MRKANPGFLFFLKSYADCLPRVLHYAGVKRRGSATGFEETECADGIVMDEPIFGGFGRVGAAFQVAAFGVLEVLQGDDGRIGSGQKTAG